MEASPDPPPRARRGRPPRLDRDQIVAAATKLTAEVGLTDFSLQTLAERLDCTAMSLYHHVENRATLERLVVEHVSASDPLPPLPTPGGEREWLVAVAHQIRARLLAHPGVAEHLLAHGPTGASMTTVDRVATVLLAAGVGIERTARSYSLLMTATTALALQQAAVERHHRRGIAPFAESHASMHTSTDLVRRLAPDFTPDRDVVFDESISLVLDGILAPG
ncbi:MAG: TetR/AcrR family transcriptional regulator C-terminal domain-containing protein [Actinomycetota bacterium]